MTVKDTLICITQIKAKAKEKILSNVVPSKLKGNDKVIPFFTEGGVIFGVPSAHITHAYYAVTEVEALVRLLQQIPAGWFVDYIHTEQNDMKDIFGRGGMSLYATYIRKTMCFEQNPYEIPEHGKRKVLQELYDPSAFEYPQETDIPCIMKIIDMVFDPICDDVFTVAEWKAIIQKRQCIIARVNGEIISIYVYCLDKVKLYSNISVNLGPANYLYNLERKIFDDAWIQGIRVHSSWKNMDNKKAFEHSNPYFEKVASSKQILYNSIWVKK